MNRRTFCLTIPILLTVLLLGCGENVPQEKGAVSPPSGRFVWEDSSGGVKLVSTMTLHPDGIIHVQVSGLGTPIDYKSQWKLRGDRIEFQAMDGAIQSYRLEGDNLVLVDNESGMPSGNVVLRRQ